MVAGDRRIPQRDGPDQGVLDERCTSFADHATLSTQAKVKASDMFSAYLEWAKQNSYEPMTKRTFGSEMKEPWVIRSRSPTVPVGGRDSVQADEPEKPQNP